MTEAELIQQWKKLKNATTCIDFEWGKWSANALIFYGDEANFIATYLTKFEGATRNEAQLRILEAELYRLIPDIETWKKLGGMAKLKTLRFVPKAELPATVARCVMTGTVAVKLPKGTRKLTCYDKFIICAYRAQPDMPYEQQEFLAKAYDRLVKLGLVEDDCLLAA
jgi:hypothetical protein